MVFAGGKIPLARHERRTVGITTEDHEVTTGTGFYAGLHRSRGFRRTVRIAVATIDPQPLELIVQHDVDDAGNGIGTIEGSGTVTQHFDTARGADR